MYKILPILLFAYGLAVTTEEIYDNSYALIIGIDKYQNVRSLDYAVKDAEDIQSMLVDKFHFKEDDIVLLKNEEATKTSILQEFSNITKKAGANDRVLIFFAGHGETEDLPDGGEMGYLLPVDGNNTDLYISAIEMDEIQTISLRSEAKHILYLIDACYGGIASVGARSLDANSTPDYLQKITQYKSRQIISAGGRGEQVIEKAEWGHSAFTKNLLSGLRDSKADTDSDGIITAQELGIYLKKKVTIDSNNRQTPKTRNLSTDEGEFVFILDEGRKNINKRLDVPISDNDKDVKIDSNESRQNIKGGNVYLGAIYHKYISLGVELENYLDDGEKSISRRGGWIFCLEDGFCRENKLQYMNVFGLSFKRYFSPFGTNFIELGSDVNVMFIYNSSLDGKDHVNYGFFPFVGIGWILTDSKFPVITTLEIGYSLIPNSNITGIAYEDLPHGLQLNIKFGRYVRKYSKTEVMLPEVMLPE